MAKPARTKSSTNHLAFRLFQHVSNSGLSQTRAGLRIGVAIGLIGLVIAIVSFVVAYGIERRHKRAEFDRLAEHLAQVVETNFRFPLEVFQSTPAFFESSEEVTGVEFETFVRGALDRHDGIDSFQWIPIVAADERERLQETAGDENLPFVIREYADDGGLGDAGDRGEYFPVLYDTPNRFMLGVDLSTDTILAPAIEKAVSTDELTASGRFRLFGRRDAGYGVAFFYPIEEEAGTKTDYRGIVSITLKLKPIMDRVLEGNYLEDTRIVLRDAEAPSDDQLLFENVRGASRSTASYGVDWRGSFRMADRRWLISMMAEPDSYWVSRTQAWGVLGLGITFSVIGGLVAMTLGTISGLKQRVEVAVQLGQYKLEEKIGEGGMGQVYRASHAMLRRPTAVKLLRAQNSSEAAVSRFEREVQLTSQLVHPNTIVIFDYGRTPEGTFYYAMEYLDGMDLGDAVKLSGPFPPERVIHVLLQMCGSLNEAHAAGLVHRDIKPSNIMLCQRGGQTDVIKLLDFGLVKDVAGEDQLAVTQNNSITGTPLYMSPEAITDAADVDGRSDLYAVGAVGYFLLTGSPVFQGNTPMQVMLQQMQKDPESPSARLGSEIPDDLQKVILSCLAKNPKDRPQSAAELERALSECQAADHWSQEEADEWWEEFGDDCILSAEKVATRELPTLDITVEIDLAER